MTTSRAARKAETRERILAAALTLLTSGRSLDSLGLREVARESGLAATSLYNHFPDMEALGLALIDLACYRLRSTMRLGRGELVMREPVEGLREVVVRFLQYLDEYEGEFRLLVQQRLGNSSAYRRRVHRELQMLVEELAEDVRAVSEHLGLPPMDYLDASEAAVAVMFGFGILALDLPSGRRHRRVDDLVTQLTMVFIGGRAMAAGVVLGQSLAKT